MLALDLESCLADAAIAVVGLFEAPGEALCWMREGRAPDVALRNFQPADGSCVPLVQTLLKHGVPIMMQSGLQPDPADRFVLVINDRLKRQGRDEITLARMADALGVPVASLLNMPANVVQTAPVELEGAPDRFEEWAPCEAVPRFSDFSTRIAIQGTRQ